MIFGINLTFTPPKYSLRYTLLDIESSRDLNQKFRLILDESKLNGLILVLKSTSPDGFAPCKYSHAQLLNDVFNEVNSF